MSRARRSTLSFLSFFVLMSAAPSARAGVLVGTGVSSVTSGRLVPSLSAGFDAGDWAASGHGTGVQTSLYYHSSWTVLGFAMWDAGELFWGPVRAGFGGGLFYANRGYRETVGGPLDKADDFNFGPAFRISWKFLGPAFLSVEAMYGLRKPVQLIVLSAQDTAHVTVGVEF